MITFIHTSDWHIGNRFADFDRETAKKLNRARLMAVEAIFIYAGIKKIPLIISVGDTIDNGRLAPEKNLLDLFKVVNRYPEISLVIITGEQDALGANCIYRRVAADSYPGNISIYSLPPAARGAFEKAPLDPAKLLEVFGSQGTFFQKGSLPPGAWERIGFGLDPENDPEKQYDYMALGGNHSYAKIDDRTYYCGTPEPLGFDEAGFPLEVTIEKPGAVPKVEKITGVQQYRWTLQKIETSDENFPQLKELLKPAGEKEIKKLEIRGFLSLENYKTCKELLQTEQNRYYEITSHIAVAPGPMDLPGDDGCIKSVAQRLMDMKKNPEPLGEEILNDVAPMGQPAVEKLARSISKDEIIDNALLKIYSCENQGTFLKKGPLDPPKTFD